jgi:hypothetical protein
MEARQAIAKIKADLSKLKNSGSETIPIEDLEKYLTSVAESADNSIELQKLELQRSVANYDAENKFSIEMFRSVIEAGREALKAALIMNGGAVIAMLGFLGTTVGKTNSNTLGLALTLPLAVFGFGVFSVGAAFVGMYLSQYFYRRASSFAAYSSHFITALATCISYALFAYGVYQAYRAFNLHFSMT